VLDDSTVVGKGRCFGGVVCTKVVHLVLNTDLCYKPPPNLVHSIILRCTVLCCTLGLSVLLGLWMSIDWQSLLKIYAGWKFVLDDRTVVDEGCFFGGGVCAKVNVIAITHDLCVEYLSAFGLVHSMVPTAGVRMFVLLFVLFFVSIWKI
jgi:hypothetical protein